MRVVTHVLAAAMILIGVAIVVRSVVEQGGSALALLIGVLFVAAGAGRLYVERTR